MTAISNQENIDRICEYRGLPKINTLQPCEVDGKVGLIIGTNTSCNFNVLFGAGITLNCHPYHKMKIFNNNGSNVIYEYKN